MCASQQQQRRANAFAAALAQVLGNLRDGAYARGGVAAQLLLDRHEVVPQQIEDLSRRRYRQCAQSLVPVLDPDASHARLIRAVVRKLQFQAQILAPQQWQ